MPHCRNEETMQCMDFSLFYYEYAWIYIKIFGWYINKYIYENLKNENIWGRWLYLKCFHFSSALCYYHLGSEILTAIILEVLKLLDIKHMKEHYLRTLPPLPGKRHVLLEWKKVTSHYLVCYVFIRSVTVYRNWMGMNQRLIFTFTHHVRL